MYKKYVNQRCLTTCAIISIVVYFIFIVASPKTDLRSPSYSPMNISIKNIIKVIEKKPERCIYFLETLGCQDLHRKSAHLTARQACAVESAARTNPNASIQLLYALPDRNRSEHFFLWSQQNNYLESLDRYDNIHIKVIYLNEYTMDTPIEKWYRSGKLQNSSFVVEHTSDILRYLTMWKFGGTYMDLDVVVMEDLETLGTDYIPAECGYYVANGVLSFNTTGLGHQIVDMFLQEINKNYKGNEWSANGPILVTRILQGICNTTNTTLMTAEHCKGFRVLPPSTFYPIHWSKYMHHFDATKLKEATDMVNASSSYATHVWNKITNGIKIKKTDKDNLYVTLAKKFCPHVYKAVDLYF